MKVAIIHYWWLSNRGGEAVCSALVELFPQADLFIHVCNEDVVRKALPSTFTGTINTACPVRKSTTRNTCLLCRWHWSNWTCRRTT